VFEKGISSLPVFAVPFVSNPLQTHAPTHAHCARRYPALYRNGIDNRSFGLANFLGWLCVGVWTSLCVYAFALWVPQVGEVRIDRLI
jgi:hypothetical protein